MVVNLTLDGLLFYTKEYYYYVGYVCRYGSKVRKKSVKKQIVDKKKCRVKTLISSEAAAVVVKMFVVAQWECFEHFRSTEHPAETLQWDNKNVLKL